MPDAAEGSDIVQRLPDVVLRYDRDGRILFANEAIRGVAGLPPSHYIGRLAPEVSPNSGVGASFAAARALVLATGRPTTIEVERAHPSGPRWFEYRLLPEQVVDGVVQTVLAIGREVTEAHHALESLRASEARYRALVEATSQVIWGAGAGGELENHLDGWMRYTGQVADPARRVGDEWLDVVHPDDRPAAWAAWSRALHTGTTYEAQYRLHRQDGAWRTVVARAAPVRDPGGSIREWIGTITDVTEWVALEAQARRSQKLEALGLLAGSIAHDFNNLLSVILGGAELARLAVPDDSPAATDLDDIRQTAARAAELTRQLLAFSRRQERRPRALDLCDSVRRSQKLLRHLIPESLVLDVNVSATPCVVHADVGQLEQVLVNLVVNARDAILAARVSAPDAPPGVVTIEVVRRTVPASPAPAQVGTPIAPGDYVALVVRDNGVGMNAEIMQRLFEPFFTTKGEGRGTGLGLATVFGIVTQSGGAIGVESAPGEGATFTVLLPAHGESVDGTDVGVAALPGGTETILLVEDERTVRETATRILERHGYRVIAMRHGADALLAWREHADAVDLVVTDLQMPEMGGKALVARLRAERPSLPCVFMSGYSSEPRGDDAAAEGSDLFLEKPFTAESLLVHVRTALDRVGPRRGA